MNEEGADQPSAERAYNPAEPKRMAASQQDEALSLQATFDRVARLSAQAIGVPIARICYLTDQGPQVEACYGMEGHVSPSSFDRDLLEASRTQVVEDVRADERFADASLVTGPAGVRFYAGVPLRAPEGHHIGSLCVLGREPRRLAEQERGRLEDLAALAVSEVELRRERLAHAQAEEARARSETRYRQLIERSSDITAVIGKKRVLRYLSPAFENVLGWRPTFEDEVVKAIPPEDRQRVAAAFTAAANEPRAVQTVAFRCRHADGSWVHLEAVVYNLYHLPVVEGMVLNARDVTERVRAEAELRTREERFRSLVERASDIITVATADGTVQYQSPSFERVLGRRPEQHVGGRLFDGIHPEDEPRARRVFAESVAHPGAVWTGQYRAQHADGHWVDLESTLQAQQAEQAVDGVIINTRDVSDSLRFEAEREARQRAEELLQTKTALLNNMNHELRTPLASILGFAEIIEEEGHEPMQEFATRIVSSARRLQTTLDTLLHLAQFEGGDEARHCAERIDVAGVVRASARPFRERAERQGLRFDVELPAEGQKAYVMLDEGDLCQVLGHLLSNALKFTEEGRVAVRVGTDAEAVRLCVEDTGCGISEEFQEKWLFEDFRQESYGLNRSHEGSGLGLAVTRRLVERMNGTIDVASREGIGTRFTVGLPRAEPPSAGDPSGSPVTPAHRA